MRTVKIDAEVYNDLRSMMQLTANVKDRLDQFEHIFVEIQDHMDETCGLNTTALWMQDGTMIAEQVNEDGSIDEVVLEPMA